VRGCFGKERGVIKAAKTTALRVGRRGNKERPGVTERISDQSDNRSERCAEWQREARCRMKLERAQHEPKVGVVTAKRRRGDHQRRGLRKGGWSFE
jgi:hypothetical protein